MTPEEYKDKQRERMRGYLVGSKDNIGNTITQIFAKTDEYLIYEIKSKALSDSVKVLIDTEVENNTTPIDNFALVREKYITLKGLFYKVVDDSSIKARIAHILSHAIAGHTGEANAQFDRLIEEIETEYRDQYKNRIKYLLTTMIIIIVGIISSIIVYAYKLFTEIPLIRHFIFIATAASIGGFISITRRLKDTVFEKNVQSYLYVFYAFERMLIAVVAGIVIYFAIQCNLIFGIMKEIPKPIFGYLVFAVVAGFSETLLPNLLIKLEKKEK